MRITDFMDPRTELNSLNNFKELNWKQKGVTLLVSAIAAVIFPIYGGFVAFRALTHYFHKADPVKAKSVPSPVHAAPSKPERTPSKTQKPMPEWKQMLYRGLSKQLASVNLKHGQAEENGDCLFDAVSQQLALIGISRTKKEIRQDIKNHLETCEDDAPYRSFFQNSFENTYERFRDRIDLCVEDIVEGAPIWGNKACLQMIADIYQVTIETYEVMKFEISLFESMDDKWDNFEKYQYHRGESDTGYEACTEMNKTTISPTEGAPVDTIRIANLTRDVWGHFVPVFPL